MAHGGVPVSGFKPETVDYVISSIQEIWSHRSEEMLQALFDFLKSNGVKCEADVEAIKEEELGTVIGPAAAKKILRQFNEQREKEEALNRDKKKENATTKPAPDCSTDNKFEAPPAYSDTAADSGNSSLRSTESASDMKELAKMIRDMHVEEGKRNREMITSMQKSMEITLKEICGNIMSTVRVMNESLTNQMDLQRQLLEKLGGEIVEMRKQQVETARHAQEWMDKSQKMNHEVLIELTRKVNAALEANLPTCPTDESGDCSSQPDQEPQKGRRADSQNKKKETKIMEATLCNMDEQISQANRIHVDTVEGLNASLDCATHSHEKMIQELRKEEARFAKAMEQKRERRWNWEEEQERKRDKAGEEQVWKSAERRGWQKSIKMKLGLKSTKNAQDRDPKRALQREQQGQEAGKLTQQGRKKYQREDQQCENAKLRGKQNVGRREESPGHGRKLAEQQESERGRKQELREEQKQERRRKEEDCHGFSDSTDMSQSSIPYFYATRNNRCFVM